MRQIKCKRNSFKYEMGNCQLQGFWILGGVIILSKLLTSKFWIFYQFWESNVKNNYNCYVTVVNTKIINMIILNSICALYQFFFVRLEVGEKKSNRVRSGDLGGHYFRMLSSKLSSWETVVDDLCRPQGKNLGNAPSCWLQNVMSLCSSNCGVRQISVI